MRKRWLLGVVAVVLLGTSTAFAATSFDDVVEGAFYDNAASWAKSNGVTFGCDSDGTKFCPDDAVTRAQNVTFAYRYHQNVVEPALDELRAQIADTAGQQGEPGPAGPAGPPGPAGQLTSLEQLDGLPCGDPGTLRVGTTFIQIVGWGPTGGGVGLGCDRATPASIVTLEVSSWLLPEGGYEEMLAQDFFVELDATGYTCSEGILAPCVELDETGYACGPQEQGYQPFIIEFKDSVYCTFEFLPGTVVSLTANFGTEATSFHVRDKLSVDEFPAEPGVCDVQLTETNCTFTAPDPADDFRIIIDFDQPA